MIFGENFIKLTLAAFYAGLLSACSTIQSDVKVSNSEAKTNTVLDRNWIEANIIGNTISGVAHFKKWGNIPFQMYFNPDQKIYQDRIVVRQTINKAFGTFTLTDEGILCRISRTRNQGNETCWRFRKDGANILLDNTENDRAVIIEIAPGKNFS